VGQLYVACSSIDKIAPEVALKIKSEIVKNRVGIVNQREILSTRLPVLGCRFLGPFVGFFEGIQGTTGLYAVESRKAGDCSFRPSADISQQTFLVPFAKHENVREKHDSEGLIQYFPRLRETGNRVLKGLDKNCPIV
jgi:hypothetical protein